MTCREKKNMKLTQVGLTQTQLMPIFNKQKNTEFIKPDSEVVDILKLHQCSQGRGTARQKLVQWDTCPKTTPPADGSPL